MRHTTARLLFLLALVAPSTFLLGGSRSPAPPAAVPNLRPLAGPRAPHADRTAFLLGKLGEEDILVATAALAAAGHPGVSLLDSSEVQAFLPHFLAAFDAERVVPVGSFAESREELQKRLKRPVTDGIPWSTGRSPEALWHCLFPRAERIVVCPAEPRRRLLQAACLAGAAHAPLYVWHDDADTPDLCRRLTGWQPREVLAVGAAVSCCRNLPGVRLTAYADEAAVRDAYLAVLARTGPVRTLVVANPNDRSSDSGRLSHLAPWLAVQRRAALLLTNQGGTDVEALVDAAVRRPGLERADHLLLLADLNAIPTERRPNPLAGKDPDIEMEPLTPKTPGEAFRFATGRLFHADPGVVVLQLARQRLLTRPPAGPRKALVASNPGGSMPLLETFSQHSMRELRNCGYQTTARFGDSVKSGELRRLLPEHDLFLWEGHHNTLMKDFGLPGWDEPMRPSLVVLQSCLALMDGKVHPLLQRGAVGVVGSSTRTYSATGGAFALAFLDALLYERQTTGGSLRQAKNFLAAYALLKEKRLGGSAKFNGANVRSSWAFTLWGDPTLTLPPPGSVPDKPGVHCRYERAGSKRELVLTLPPAAYGSVTSGKYTAKMPPNARLAGLLRADDDGKQVTPFAFAEVAIPDAPAGQTPHLKGTLPGKDWAFLWDGHGRRGYLIVALGTRARSEVRFRVSW